MTQDTDGKSLPRKDAREKVTGRAVYTVDLRVPGMVDGFVLRSPHAHARVVAIHTAEAQRVPGVLCVFTRADVADIDPHFGQALLDQPLIATKKVRVTGEPVAVVVAEDPAAAREALDKIQVEYEPLPAVMTIDEALAPGAPALHGPAELSPLSPDVRDVRPEPERNICNRWLYQRGDTAAAFTNADHVFDHTFTLPALHHFFLEPLAAIASFEGDGLTVWVGTQTPFALRTMLSSMFHLPLSRVRIVVPFVGGGFGGRELIAASPLAAAVSRKAGRPVRIVLSSEETCRTIARHAARIRIRTAATRDGTIMAREAQIHWQTGAYADQGPRVIKKGGYRVVGPYKVPNVKVESVAVYTNTVSAGAYRGFSTPQVAWAYESQMDIMARALGMDPVAFRLKNMLKAGEEYAPGDRPVDSDLPDMLRRAAAAIAAERGPKRGPSDAPAATHALGVEGVGVAAVIKDGGGTRTSSTAIVRLHSDASATVLVGAVEMGQGVHTALAQVVAGELGLDPRRVTVAQTDTGVTPFDQRTNASRGISMMAPAAQEAARDVAAQLFAVAAELWGVPPGACRLEAGAVVAGDRRMTIGETILRFFRDADGELIGRGYSRPAAGTAALGAVSTFWEIGIGGVRIAVDRETGAIAVPHFVTVADAGRIVNRQGVEGQDLGAAMMGLGPVLFEELVYDGDQLLNPSLVDYRLPLFTDLPGEFESIIVEGGMGPGPGGAKGVAEGGGLPIAPAIANALAAATGVRITDLPLTPERVWRALRAASAAGLGR
jgi:CO/xanthine dehydrogenase Mo-binding subunit